MDKKYIKKRYIENFQANTIVAVSNIGTIGGWLTNNNTSVGRTGFPITGKAYDANGIETYYIAATSTSLFIGDISGNTCIVLGPTTNQQFVSASFNEAVRLKTPVGTEQNKYYITNSLLILMLNNQGIGQFNIPSPVETRTIHSMINYPWGNLWLMIYLSNDNTNVNAPVTKAVINVNNELVYAIVPGDIKNFPDNATTIMGANNVNLQRAVPVLALSPARTRASTSGPSPGPSPGPTPRSTSGLYGNGLQTITPANAEWVPGFTNLQVMMAGGGLLLLVVLLKK
jgi:hypothetical protein